jgi:TRAP-type C4-dicarboxylate transport system substrate-binding protein
MVERHKRINTHYVGRWLHGPFFVWLKEPVKTPQDLKGRRLGTQDLHDRFLTALGAVPVTVSMSKTHAALKDGKVEGVSSPLMGARERGWTETCKYIIDHPFYNQNCIILMNLDIWKSFPETLQEKITSITAWFEPYMVGYFDSRIEMERKELERIDVKNIRFSPSDAESYLNAAYEVEWDALKEKAPDLLTQLRELTEY